MAYDIIFYVLTVLIIFTSLVCAFSKDLVRSAFAVFTALIGISAIYVLLHSELFALVNMLFVSAIGLTILIFSPKINSLGAAEQAETPKTNYISTVTISLLAAIVSSLAAATRWQRFEIDYSLNSYLLIFSKFLPIVIMVVLIASVITFSLKFILKEEEIT